MKKYKAGITALLTLGGIATTVLVGTSAATTNTALAAPPGDRSVIAHLFQWRWSDIANECTTVLGPKGYGGVQVSPPAEHAVLPSAGSGGYPWWQDYQPISYRLDKTRRGTLPEFEAMTAACERAGVKVYADVIVNHMTGQNGGGTGSAGTTISTKYRSPDLHGDGKFGYGDNDFGSCRRDISNWNDAGEIRTCELLGLADLRTGDDYVREQVAEYLFRLVRSGVDGFRVDAAKHIYPADMAAIKNKVTNKVNAAGLAAPYYYQEVWYEGTGEPITPADYFGTGDTNEFRAGTEIAKKFKNTAGTISDLVNSNYGSGWGLIPGDKAVPFIDNHDTQRDELTKDHVLTYKDGALYKLANVFQLGWPYGTPVVMSSFAFTNRDTSPPRESNGDTKPVTSCGGEWVCEHRYRETANMTGFRNAVGSAPVGDKWINGNQTAWGRGDKGYVVINRTSGTLSREFDSSLPAGTYCDVIDGDFDTGAATCSGRTVTVNADGRFTAPVSGMDALALHVGARTGGVNPTPTPTSATVYYKTNWTNPNIHYGIGGTWTTVPGVAMETACTGWFKKNVSLGTAGTFAVTFNDGSGSWDNNGDRNYTLGTGLTTVKDGVVTGGATDPCAGSTPSPTAGDPTTLVRVHYDAGFGHRITIRGDRAPLSWTTGQECVNKAAALWECSIKGIPAGQGFAFKPLVDDSRWSIGGDHTGIGGQTVEVTPQF
ncbi:carbohydrate binding domain-containing protein [Streptosporangium soli]|nr:alpha-amylase family glycosyl hydrolase [Streptosporangium sp. KLBMP 9127]